DKQAKEYQKKVSDFNTNEANKQKNDATYVKQRMSPHYFTMMKQLALLGFFTSKPGATQALRYNPVPGKFEGIIPYKKGDRAWA
ncbi:MAG: gluconate 2-dehydrogenase subunit 3 family protein, partial [Bacteroidota bacterium]|nr:gluconate 2-dehydrogenase subunit 3 family protein [Bacteroidota bacterium]